MTDAALALAVPDAADGDAVEFGHVLMLKLLPAPRRNPNRHRAFTIDTLDQRHREWVDGLGTLRTRDGAEFNKARLVPYAYRHCYAQRHADAGVSIDVLAELLDHRNLNVTRRYFRVGEERRRDAVDKVTALSFDRHGNRIWRDAQALLESEHARYAVGEVAVPYGICTEPSNVQAGGGACPARFRCAGCDHFRTNISFLPDLTVPGRPAAHPRTSIRRHRRRRRLGPRGRHPGRRGDHPNPAAHRPDQK